jgi:hypothetical protein
MHYSASHHANSLQPRVPSTQMLLSIAPVISTVNFITFLTEWYKQRFLPLSRKFLLVANRMNISQDRRHVLCEVQLLLRLILLGSCSDYFSTLKIGTISVFFSNYTALQPRRFYSSSSAPWGPQIEKICVQQDHLYLDSDSHCMLETKWDSRDSSVGKETGYRMDDRGSIRSKDNYFSYLHSVHTGSEADPASYPMGTVGYFPGDKAAGA